MKHLLTLGILLLLLFTTTTWSQDTWVKTFGGTWIERGLSITTKSDRSVLITGFTSSTDNDDSFNKNGRDILVIKLDGDGDLLWKKTFGGRSEEYGQSITTTSDDDILITGFTSSYDSDFNGMDKGSRDVFVIKLDKDGQVLWKKTFGGTSSEEGNSITTTSDGGILITGYTGSNDGDFNGMNKGDRDIFIIKLDKNGSVLWKKIFGGEEHESGWSITTTWDGGILITGYTYSNDGDFNGMNKGSQYDLDIVGIKLDRNGSLLWKKTFGGSSDDDGKSITTTSDGGILITGYSSSNDGDFKGMNKGSGDIFVIKLDMSGSILWKKTFGGTGHDFDFDFGNSISTTKEGSILITGTNGSFDGDFEGMNKGGQYDLDIVVIKLDMSGSVLWKKTFGGTRSDDGPVGTTTSDDGILVTGSTTSNDGDFKGMNKGNYDIFVMKLDSNGNLKPKGKKSKKK